MDLLPAFVADSDSSADQQPCFASFSAGRLPAIPRLRADTQLGFWLVFCLTPLMQSAATLISDRHRRLPDRQ
jgi:hypothetical protein